MALGSSVIDDTIALPLLDAWQTEPQQGLWHNNCFVSAVSQADK